MEHLKNMLNNPKIKGVVRSADGEIVEFYSPGVKDIYCLVATRRHVLDGACVADRVIGRGAALLLAMGHVSQVFARLISEQAVQVLQAAGIAVYYDAVVPNIINRDGTDICPVEKLTMNIVDPDVAFERIRGFLINNNIIES